MKTMKQFTTEEAIAFAKSEVWKAWDHEQIVRLQLFQDKLCVPFDRFHEAIESVLGRSVWTHEFASNNIKEEYLGTRQAPTLEEIINLIPEEKRIILSI